MSAIGDTWYRYFDNCDRETSEHVSAVHLVEFTVVAETRATVVLVRSKYIRDDGAIPDYATRHRVLKDARKRFAYPTKDLAWNSYRIRNRWRVARLEADLHHAQSCQAYVRLVDGLRGVP